MAGLIGQKLGQYEITGKPGSGGSEKPPALRLLRRDLPVSVDQGFRVVLDAPVQ